MCVRRPLSACRSGRERWPPKSPPLPLPFPPPLPPRGVLRPLPLFDPPRLRSLEANQSSSAGSSGSGRRSAPRLRAAEAAPVAPPPREVDEPGIPLTASPSAARLKAEESAKRRGWPRGRRLRRKGRDELRFEERCSEKLAHQSSIKWSRVVPSLAQAKTILRLAGFAPVVS